MGAAVRPYYVNRDGHAMWVYGRWSQGDNPFPILNDMFTGPLNLEWRSIFGTEAGYFLEALIVFERVSANVYGSGKLYEDISEVHNTFPGLPEGLDRESINRKPQINIYKQMRSYLLIQLESPHHPIRSNANASHFELLFGRGPILLRTQPLHLHLRWLTLLFVYTH